MVQIIDGASIAKEIREEIKQSILQNPFHRSPKLVVVQVGEHPASLIYIQNKIKACHEVGIESQRITLAETISEEELLENICLLNEDESVDGILVQLPLPRQINPMSVNSFISPHKDVDGFNPISIGKLLLGETDGFIPCTPLGIRVLLERYQIQTTGKNALIIGRSNIVGKPLAAMLMQNHPYGNATVTIAHSKTHDLTSLTKQADILIAAIGHPHLIKEEMVKEGAVVIDVGINRLNNSSKIVGDVDFDRVKNKCSFISPVPKGVGPMTIAMLLQNTYYSFNKKHT